MKGEGLRIKVQDQGSESGASGGLLSDQEYDLSCVNNYAGDWGWRLVGIRVRVRVRVKDPNRRLVGIRGSGSDLA